jgi:hypothetical protein
MSKSVRKPDAKRQPSRARNFRAAPRYKINFRRFVRNSYPTPLRTTTERSAIRHHAQRV